MKHSPRVVAAAAFLGVFPVLALARVRTAAPTPRKYPLPLEPRVYETYGQKIRVSVVVHGIGRPWSLLPLPNGDFLVGVTPTGQVELTFFKRTIPCACSGARMP